MLNQFVSTVILDLRQQLSGIYGDRLDALLLFGSQARGQSERDSEIDVLVVLKGPVDPGKEIGRTGAIQSSLSLKYDRVVSCVFVSDQRYSSEQSPLLINIRREGMNV